MGGGDPTKKTLPCPVQGQAGSLLLLQPPMQNLQLLPRGITVASCEENPSEIPTGILTPITRKPRPKCWQLSVIIGGWKTEKLTPDTKGSQHSSLRGQGQDKNGGLEQVARVSTQTESRGR